MAPYSQSDRERGRDLADVVDPLHRSVILEGAVTAAVDHIWKVAAEKGASNDEVYKALLVVTRKLAGRLHCHGCATRLQRDASVYFALVYDTDHQQRGS